MNLRFLISLWAAKLSIPLLKVTKHNGTDFPGSLALKICPKFLHFVEKPKKIIAVTGTNGKTTLSNLLIDVLEQNSKKILHNREGSNIISGISTAFIKNCNFTGKIKNCDLAVLEVDERSSARIYKYLTPTCIVVTNLFRDSIMRNAHPEYIANFMTNSIPAESKLILNADDLISCSIAKKNDRIYFGMSKLDSDVTECENLLNDMRICPICSGKLEYQYRKYHHIGKATCCDCGFTSPDADFLAHDVNFDNMTMYVSERNHEDISCKLISDSIFNVYNMIAAIATLRQIGLSYENIIAPLENAKIISTRYSREQIGNIGIIMQMTKDKNALACSRNFDYIRKQPGKKELFLMMNCIGVSKTWSENPSWMYDTDFEFIIQDDVTQYVCAGARAYDYKLRLLLAGAPEKKISVNTNEFEALKLLNLKDGEDIYILYGVDGVPLAFKVKEKLKEILEKGGHSDEN